MSENVPKLMQEVKLIVLDVDGTLTDGSIVLSDVGEQVKTFHVADGLGIVMAKCVGIRFAVLSGRRSIAVERRMSELGISDVLQGVSDKGVRLRSLMERLRLRPPEVAFVGDDVNDLPAFGVVGVKIAVADAAQIVRERADYVTPRGGGRGGVRDAVDEILRRQGRLDEAVQAYLNRPVTATARQ